MSSEDFDELMGPSKEALSGMLNDPPGASPAVRTSSSGAPPPAAMFGESRWGQEPTQEDTATANHRAVTMASEHVALRESLSASASAVETRRTSTMSMEEDDANPSQIRQEALRMLEVAGDRNSGYNVHRTTTGGFQASASSRRIPAALGGLVTAARTSYRDDPYAMDSDAPVVKSREAYEYGDDSVVDVAGMENRFGGSRPVEQEKSWSSRYSVDRTLLALSGGAGSSRNAQVEKENKRARTSARNLFGNKGTNVFGSGFSFRSSNVYGKQGANVSTTNLKTEWMSTSEREATLGVAVPAKTWQEQLARKRQTRRRMIIGSLVALVLAIIIASAASRSKRSSAMSSSGPQKVSFFITSTMPLNSTEQHRMESDLKNPVLKEGAFLVHLGNLQLPEVTNCRPELYEDVADRLLVSPIPTFVLPGNNDWNDCPHPSSALSHWRDNFYFFDTNWKSSYDVERQVNHEENFAMEINGVLFIGVFEVGGRIYDWDEFMDRHQNNYHWVRSRMEKFSNARAVVIMGSAPPHKVQNQLFFDQLADHLELAGKPALYVHSNTGYHGSFEYHPYDGYHLMAAQAPHGGDYPPLRIDVGFGEDPFNIDFDGAK